MRFKQQHFVLFGCPASTRDLLLWESPFPTPTESVLVRQDILRHELRITEPVKSTPIDDKQLKKLTESGHLRVLAW